MLRKRIPAPPEIDITPHAFTPDESSVQAYNETYETDENTLSELIQMTPTNSPDQPSQEMDPLNLDTSPCDPDSEGGLKKIRLRDRIVNAKTVLQPCNSGMKTVTNIVAIDCEMVACGGGRRKLARCSIVNYEGHVLFDEYIKPDEPVVDFLTYVSGITQQKIRFAPLFTDVKARIFGLLKNKVVVGHTLSSDFKALNFKMDPKNVRDIQRFKRYRFFCFALKILGSISGLRNFRNSPKYSWTLTSKTASTPPWKTPELPSPSTESTKNKSTSSPSTTLSTSTGQKASRRKNAANTRTPTLSTTQTPPKSTPSSPPPTN
jgi:DNA polymerase III epsilon subunit-like protein